MEMPNGKKMKNTRRTNYKRKRKEEGVKVVYISSPLKVQTSASEFRALVQELTGQDSDVSRFMETDGAGAADCNSLPADGGGSRSSSDLESPTSSGSLLEPLIMDDVFVASNDRMEEGFLGGLFPSNFSFVNSGLGFDDDVLGSYDAL